MSKRTRPLPIAVLRMLGDLKWALVGWDGSLHTKEDTAWADITLRPSQVRRMYRVIERYQDAIAKVEGNQ